MNDVNENMSPLAPDQGKAKDKTILKLGDEIRSLELKIEHMEFDRTHKRQELSNARRLFMELYQENRTINLRFQWLEEKATDAVNACEKHEAENMDALRDELGLEMRGD